MTRDEIPAFGLDDLQHLLDAFGADPSRWPAASRGPAQALLGSSATARKLMQGTVAMDALLARASTPPVERLAALRDRIASAAAGVAQTGVAPTGVAKAGAREAGAHELERPTDAGPPDRSIARPAATVVPLRPPSAAARSAPTARPQEAAAATLRGRPRATPWRAATALAASLAFGIFVGSLDLSPLPVQSLLEISGPDHEVGQLVATLNAEGFQSQLDEDQL